MSSFTRGEQFILDWQYQKAGSFDKALAEAISKADEKNLAAFMCGFPEETTAMIWFKRKKDWWQTVQNKYFKNIKRG